MSDDAPEETKERGPAFATIPRSFIWLHALVDASSDAKLVAFFALSAPTGGVCPVMTVYEQAISDLTALPTRRVRAALAELEKSDLVYYDRKAAVMYVRVALTTRPPRGPKQVAAVRSGLDLVKDCPLVRKAREDIARTLVETDREFFLNTRGKRSEAADTVSPRVCDTNASVQASAPALALASAPASAPVPPPEPAQPASANPRKPGDAVHQLVKHLDPQLATKLRDVWGAGPNLDILVEQLLENISGQSGVRNPAAVLVTKVRDLHNDPEGAAAFHEHANEIRAKREAKAKGEQERVERETKAKGEQERVEREAADRAAQLEAEWSALHATNALPDEPLLAFKWRVQDAAQGAHNPRSFIASQYEAKTKRTMREAHGDAQARGLSLELPASFPRMRVA